MKLKSLIAFLFLSITNLMAQPSKKNFAKEWKEIDSLIFRDNVTKTALNKVENIYNKAKRFNQNDEMIKALLYKTELIKNIKENSLLINIENIKGEIEITKDPATESILWCLQANAYLQFYEQHSWKIENRKVTNEKNKNDINFWSKEDFFKEINKCFNNALAPSSILQNIPTQKFELLILRGSTNDLRPTLYDLISHQIIDYAKQQLQNNYLTANKKSNNESTLGTINNFLSANFIDSNQTDFSLTIIHLYQQLLKFHSNNKFQNAFIDVNLERILWAYEKNNSNKKDELYLNALQEIINNYPRNNVSSAAAFYKAKYFYDRANKYEPLTKTIYKDDNIKAIETINKALSVNNDSSEACANLRMLKTYIERQELNTEVEEINIPNKPFRLLVKYRNIDKIYYRIIKIKTGLNSTEKDELYDKNSDEFWEIVCNKKIIINKEQLLPIQNDYQLHSCEIKIDALPIGNYAIIMSNSNSFNPQKDKLVYTKYVVSQLGFIKNNGDVFVVDRDNGNPISKAIIKVFTRSWHNGKYEVKLANTLQTNDMGFASIKKLGNKDYNNDYIITIVKNGDTLTENDVNFYIEKNNNDLRTNDEVERDYAKITFFTDRGIYRPGQTVYFKGIATTQSKFALDKKLFFTKPKNKVFLYDKNHKAIDTIEVELNEFGSFNGEFKIPQNVLTGYFTLRTEHSNGYKNFRVEEYKRPKFFVDFDKQKEEFTLNKNIEVVGNAKAYSGNKIDGAKVVYTVTRSASYSPYNYYWRMPNNISSTKQITNGESKTDAQGKFIIKFLAEADEDIDRTTNPTFSFVVNASITDINGETRESSTSIQVSYNALKVFIDAPQKAEYNQLNQIKIGTTNIAGETIATNVDIEIYSLKTPQRLIRQRLWQQPDTFVMNENEYIQYFPNDEYSNETNKSKWQQQQLLFKSNVQTIKDSATTKVDLNLTAQLQNTQYILIIAKAKDKLGNIVENKSLVEITKNGISIPQYHLVGNVKSICKPNDTAEINFTTQAKDVFVLKQLITANNEPEQENNNYNYSFVKIDGKFNWLKQTATNDYTGFGLYYAFVKHNRFYSNGINVEIEKPSKKLNITYASFRDKTLPGSKENFSIKIKGPQGEKVAAELLTAMYDASLDQFSSNSFNMYLESYDRDFNSQMQFSGIELNEEYQTKNFNTEFKIKVDYYKYARLIKNINEYTIKEIAKIAKFQHIPPNELIDEVEVSSNITSYKKKIYVGAASKIRESDLNYNASNEKYLGENILIRGSSSIAANNDVDFDKSLTAIYGSRGADKNFINSILGISKNTNTTNPKPQVRKNFSETAFFFPTIYADKEGNYSFNFTMPEALTTWKWLSFAHTKNLETANSVKEIITAKPIMVQPNVPRFLREEDIIEFTAKVINTTNADITGTATLELIDATNGNSVDGLCNNVFPLQYFTATANQSALVKFPLQIPSNFAKPLTYRIIAFVPAKPTLNQPAYSDGEENTLPVLTNKIFITESTPIYVKGTEQEKTIDIKPMLNTSKNKTGESITIEYTANPIWSVVKALPYLMEFPYECAEQTFNKFFANTMASSIINNNINIKNVIDTWKADSNNVKSNLEINAELKNIILQETPWVADAELEVEKQKRLALLLDLKAMQNNQETILQKIKSKQLPNGAFSWFDGGRENEYITQYIVTGIGKLKSKNTVSKNIELELNDLAKKAIKYLDAQQEQRYLNWLKVKQNPKKYVNCYNNPMDYYYWYMRSMFAQIKLSKNLKKSYSVYKKEVAKNWNKQSIYTQALMALSIHYFEGNNRLSKRIMNAINENSVEDDDKGTVYWKENKQGYYWYQNNIETQALLIEAFNEIVKNNNAIDKMKTWLILNKQTNSWNSTISTSAACFALLNYGNNWVNNQQQVLMKMGDFNIQSNQANGYIKERLNEVQVNKIMNENQPIVTIKKQNNNATSPSYGAIFYQYFANSNDVENSVSQAPLSLVKKLFIEKNDGKKKVLKLVEENEELNIGDKLIVRIELKCDRLMEFIHLKDMRAANTEPVNVLSSYKWQGGLGYYESTKDASTNFFIDYIQKGSYVFEYPLYVTHSGKYSVGLAQIQCTYAPEFTSHSNGLKIEVK